MMEGNKEILNEAEKKILGRLSRLTKIRWVKKVKDLYKPKSHIESIIVYYSDDIQPTNTLFAVFDDFEEGLIYKGMEEGKAYTLKELCF